MTAPRLAMIGLDAADLDFVRAAGTALPTLRRLLETTTAHALRSPVDLLPGAVWPTFYTGASPGEHGIYHHLQWDAAAMRLRRVAAEWLYAEPFWYELARRGRRVVALDVPMTFPSRLADGVEVTNWGSHDDLGGFAARPAALAGEIRRRFGRHPMGNEIPVGKSAGEIRRIRDRLVRGAARKAALARWLAERAPWDLFVAVFGETHRGGHILWPDGPYAEAVPPDALLDVYRAVDAGLGELLASPALAGARLVVFALHGMGPNTSQEHFMAPVMDRVNARFAGDATRGPAAPPALVRWLREHVPGRVQGLAARVVPVPMRDVILNRSVIAGHDWRRTAGFDLLADLSGYVRLNLRGRERHGTLAPDGDDARRYAAWVRRCFESLRVAGTNEPLVGAVHASAERFAGRRLHLLPDLITTWSGRPPVARVESPELGTIEAELATGRSGNHHPTGFCLLGAGLERLPAPTDIRDLARVATATLG